MHTCMNEYVAQEQMTVPSQVCDTSSLMIKGINVVIVSEEEELTYVWNPLNCIQLIRSFATGFLRNDRPYQQLKFSWESPEVWAVFC